MSDIPRSSVAATRKTHRLSPFERWVANAGDSQLNAVSGAFGGFMSGIVTCPLDNIKTRLQAQGGYVPFHLARDQASMYHQVHKGFVGTASGIWNEGGVRGMFRGLGPVVLGYLPTWAIWFTVYNKSKMKLYEGFPESSTFVINFWSSVVAGFGSTIATNPIWVIKTRLMTQLPYKSYSTRPGFFQTPLSANYQPHWYYRSTLDAVSKIYRAEGLPAFYSGLGVALLGLAHVGVQFPVYEYLKTAFTSQGMGSPGTENVWLGVLSASILSKAIASTTTYPHEVIRTRLQIQRHRAPGAEFLHGIGGLAGSRGLGFDQGVLQPRYKSALQVVTTVFREEGWRAFYSGMGTNLLRAIPASTVTMLTYEYTMTKLMDARQRAIEMQEELLAD